MDSSAITANLARYRFHIELENSIREPIYAGSMLRGAFGHALRKTSCITSPPDHDVCLLAASCPYCNLFATTSNSDQARYADVAPPIVIEAPLNMDTQQPSKRLVFNMVLIGPSLQYLSHIILAWQRAGLHGFGKQRTKGKLTHVEWLPETKPALTIYAQNESMLVAHTPNTTLTPNFPSDSINLSFTTPARLKQKGKYCNGSSITAVALLSALERKVKYMNQRYLGLNLPPTAVNDLTLSHHSLRVIHWTRYSSRQHQTMDLNGLVGNFTLTGNMQSWWPYIQLGTYLHIGKNTSFGLGQLEVLS